MKIQSFDCETGIETLRDATEDEILQFEEMAKIALEEKKAIEQKEEKRIELLKKLGLTNEEAAILLG